MMARSPRAPVPRSSALSAMEAMASSVNSSSTPSSSKSFWYCLTRALRGSVRIWTRASLSSLLTLAISGQAADELGDQAELGEVLGTHQRHQVLGVALGLAAHLGGEAEGLLADPLLHDLLEAGEGAADDEQDVGGVDLDELLVGVLATPLRRHRGGGALEHLEQRLLHALARDVARDRGVLRLAGHLVDLVDVDDAGLGLLDVVVGGLDQLEEDVLDVLADVAGLGQRGRVGDREGDVEHPGQRLGQVGLAAAGRAR